MRFLKTYETNNNKINVTKNHRHEKNTKMSANENDVAHRGGGGEEGGASSVGVCKRRISLEVDETIGAVDATEREQHRYLDDDRRLSADDRSYLTVGGASSPEATSCACAALRRRHELRLARVAQLEAVQQFGPS